MRWAALVFVTGCTSLLGLSGVPNADRDGDGTEDDFDNCADIYNPDQSNIDVDELGDACDVCDAGNEADDVDGDGIPDPCDGCISNGMDVDKDDIPDNCDPCLRPDGDCNPCFGGDADGDGIPNSCDICFGSNADPDGDGIPELCDPCPGSATDADSDGIQDACDVCVGSADVDGDGLQEGLSPGCDACIGPNHDEDGDGVLDSCPMCLPTGNCRDNCPHVDNPGQANSRETTANSDSAGDACDDSPLRDNQLFDGFGVVQNPAWFITGAGWSSGNDAVRVTTNDDSDRALGLGTSQGIIASTRMILHSSGTKSAGVFIANGPSPWLASVHFRCAVTGTEILELTHYNGKTQLSQDTVPVPPGPIFTTNLILTLEIRPAVVGGVDATCTVLANNNRAQVVRSAQVAFPQYPGIGCSMGDASFLWFDVIGPGLMQ